jgi:hypothetical protein
MVFLAILIVFHSLNENKVSVHDSERSPQDGSDRFAAAGNRLIQDGQIAG